MSATKGLLAAILVAGLAGAAIAGDPPASSKMPDFAKEFVAKAGEGITLGAHWTGKKQKLLSYSVAPDREKDYRVVLTMKVEYYGWMTGHRYVADIDAIIDTTTPIDVIEIKYTDNNTIPSSATYIERARKEINAKLRGDQKPGSALPATPDFDRDFAAKTGEGIVLAAHHTGQNVKLVSHTLTPDAKKETRATLTMQVEYYGKVTGKRYIADVETVLDIGGSPVEILEIKYADNNWIPHSKEKVEAKRKDLNDKMTAR